jgi:hypothetical protein
MYHTGYGETWFIKENNGPKANRQILINIQKSQIGSWMTSLIT